MSLVSRKYEKGRLVTRFCGVRVVYFPRTKGTSSTMLSATLKKLREGGGA